jgi:hypothetical protein
MPSPRWLARFTIPLMVGTVLVATAATAAADATDDTYLAQLRGLGFTWPPGDDADILLMARHICADRWNHWTPDAIAQDIHSTLGPRGINFGDVTSMVSLTESTYCPS